MIIFKEKDNWDFELLLGIRVPIIATFSDLSWVQTYHKKLLNVSSTCNILKYIQSSINLSAYWDGNVDKYIFRQNKTGDFRIWPATECNMSPQTKTQLHFTQTHLTKEK